MSSIEKGNDNAQNQHIRTRRRRIPLRGIVFFSILVIIGAGITTANFIGKYGNTQTKVCTIESKDRASSGDKTGASSMRLYTQQCGVLSVNDRLFVGYFESADTYASLKEGHTYEMHTIGRRIPLMSTFPNVISAKEVQPS